jgi:phenylacetate-CoA ligase
MNLRLKLIDLIGQTNIHAWYQFLQKSQYWSIEQQVSYQESKLKLLAEHAYNNVPYYQKLFTKLKLKPNDIRKLSDLQKLPVISRKTLQNNYNELMARNHKDYKSQFRSTGGTTGEPAKYVSDINSWSLHWALKYRSWSWGGYKIGDKVAVFGGTSVIPEEKTTLGRITWKRLNNFTYLPMAHSSEEDLAMYAKLIKMKNIRFLRGYPSSLALFASYCTEHNIKLDIKGVVTTAEVLLPIFRKSIHSAFGPLIIDTYGCADGGGNANTCRFNSGFHISAESAIWEICDSQGFPIGNRESGEITLTSLTNYAMPLLRYQPGDVIENSIEAEVCSCGCTLPRIKAISGRTTDSLKFSNGRTLAGPALTVLFSKFPLKKYQIVQNKNDEIEIKIIPSKDFNQDQYHQLLLLMQHHCGNGINIIINIVDNIPLPKSGKHRFIINNSLL